MSATLAYLQDGEFDGTLEEAFWRAYQLLLTGYTTGFADARQDVVGQMGEKAPAVNYVPQDQPAAPRQWDPQGY